MPYLDYDGLTRFKGKLDNTYKPKQTAKTDPSASGTGTEFIDTITQDANGVITATKKTVKTLTGATSNANGSAGLAPAPTTADTEKFLSGDGTWKNAPTSKPYVFELDMVNVSTAGAYTHTTSNLATTSTMKALNVECSNPDIFKDKITITVNEGSITFACGSVAVGTSYVTVTVMEPGDAESGGTTIRSQEFDILANRITAKMDKASGAAPGKYLQINSSGTPVWGEAASPTAVASATTAWLDANIPTGQTVVVDSSLSISGAAADAKETGLLKSAMNNQLIGTNMIGFFVNGNVNESTGAINYGVSTRLILEENIKVSRIDKIVIDKTNSAITGLQFGLYTFTPGTAAPAWSGWKSSNIVGFNIDAGHTYNIMVGKSGNTAISASEIRDVSIYFYSQKRAITDATDIANSVATNMYDFPPFMIGSINESTGEFNIAGGEIGTRLTSIKPINFLQAQNLVIVPNNNNLSFGLYTFTPGTAAPAWSNWKDSDISFAVDTSHTYAIMIKKGNDENITAEDLIGTKIYGDYLDNKFIETQSEISAIQNGKLAYLKMIGDGIGVFSKTGTESNTIAITDSGSLNAVFIITENQSSKCIFNTVGTQTGSRFYLDFAQSNYGNNRLVIKVGSNNEKRLINLETLKIYNVEITWDGVTDSSNKIYSVKVNNETIESGIYTGTISGNLKIMHEGSWACANLQWLSMTVNGVLIDYNNTFEYRKSLLIDSQQSANETSILAFNPKTVTTPKLDNASRAFHNDETTASATAPFMIMWCSDIHGDTANTKRLNDFFTEYSSWFDDAIHTGDLTSTYAESTTFWEPCKGFLNVIGNHEYWGDIVGGSRQYKTPLEVYQKFMAPYIINWAGVVFPSDAATYGKSYYYKDYSTKKIRLIVLDYKEVSYNESSVQNTWLAGVLANTLDSSNSAYGYSVVIAVHAPAFLSVQDYKNPFDSLDIKSNKDGVISTLFVNTVESFIGNGGKFVCWITGHNHTDHFGLGASFPNQLNIAVGTASYSSSANTFDLGRTVGTESQDLFNIFAVDTRSEYVKLIRIGAKYDRQLRKRETLCYYYGRKTFDTNISYSIGEIVKKDEKLYQFTAPHSGAWTGTDVCEIDRLIYAG